MSAARQSLPLTRLVCLVLVALIAPLAPALAAKAAPEPLSVFGWVENIVIEPYGFEVKARVDTGANTASMQGENIEFFKRDGKKWVRFELEVELSHQDNDDDHPSVIVERPLVRTLVINKSFKKDERRPVVEMDICLDGERRTEEFNLRDRDHMHYPVLIGRKILRKTALVDSRRTFLTKPGCEAKR